MGNENVNSDASLFLTAFRGEFQGVLRWPQLDALWSRVLQQQKDDWFLYAVGETPPVAVATAAELEAFVTAIDQLLRREHKEDYCGIVYADNVQEPGFIKVFDPGNLGSTCGSSGAPLLPGWILCKLAPIDLQAALPPPKNRRNGWQRIFHGRAVPA